MYHLGRYIHGLQQSEQNSVNWHRCNPLSQTVFSRLNLIADCKPWKSFNCSLRIHPPPSPPLLSSSVKFSTRSCSFTFRTTYQRYKGLYNFTKGVAAYERGTLTGKLKAAAATSWAGITDAWALCMAGLDFKGKLPKWGLTKPQIERLEFHSFQQTSTGTAFL